ncbi:MAG: hypothetical protein KDA47_24725, partial [Planctomycetales bacterium]|nr:hypothetical protein [Planctomycetales bacterium]
MTTLVDEPFRTDSSSREPVGRLRASTAAMRLAFTWFGTRKTLSAEQKAQAAESFGADGPFLSAGKKLIDTGHPRFKAVTSVRSRAAAYFKGVSLPYPEPGIRLIRQDDLELVSVQMTTLRADLTEAVALLDEHFEELKASARSRLGRLYSAADYPATLRGLFDMTWDFPSVEPPDYLRQLSPELYRQECQRVQARFDEAVQLAEAAFIEELAKLVSHLTDRLAGHEDGKPKVFRDSAVENLTQFFDRFRNLNVGSNEQLDQLVTQAQGIVRDVRPQQLRDDGTLRQQIATQLSGVQSVLDGLLVDRPRRNILRRPR